METADGVVIRVGAPNPADLQRYEDALSQAPQDTRVRSFYSDCLYMVGRRTEAIEQLQLVIEQSGVTLESLGRLAAWLNEAGRFAEAERACRQAIEPGFAGSVVPQQSEALQRWTLSRALLGQDRVAEAVRELRDASDLLTVAVAEGSGSPHLLRSILADLDALTNGQEQSED